MIARPALAALLALAFALFAPAPSAAAQSVSERGTAAVEAYRAGDHATASAIWESLLEEPLTAEDRGRVLYDLGNAAYRRGDLMQAIAWYTSCVRVTPRNHAAWNNLEFARREAQLEPADRGDLRSTVARLLSSVNDSEAGWMLLVGIGLWAIVLLGEALRGGAVWRRLALCGVPVVLASAAPLVWRVATRPDHPQLMVVERPAASLRAEPGDEHTAVAQAGAGMLVERLDELGDWVRVETRAGERGWTPRSSVFEIR